MLLFVTIERVFFWGFLDLFVVQRSLERAE
jgi:hypothetical protein